jgi:hypothetical protein
MTEPQRYCASMFGNNYSFVFWASMRVASKDE